MPSTLPPSPLPTGAPGGESFTPGPWKYGHLGTETLWVGPDYDQTPVALVEHDTTDARDNSRANARLIAAAPELASASQTALVALGAVYHDWDGEPEDMVPVQEAMTLIRAALAKASTS